MVSTSFSSLVALAALLASASPSSTSAAAAASPRVHPGVHRALRRQGTVNLIVSLKQGTAAPLSAVQEASFDSRGAKIEALVNKLQKHAVSSQVDVTKMLFQEAATPSETPLFSKVESLWISNELYFENASFELVEKLAALGSVGEIREEERLSVSADVGAGIQATVNTTAAAVEWGVSIIKATDVWATGNTGQGIVVGGIDTGVRATHEILRGNFRSSYGWFDGTAGQATPYDDDGHGTHTLGTAVGAMGVGVAPGAQWIGCRGCGGSACTESALKACMQFMTCPTDVSGKNKDCSKAPHVVNNSWGGGSSEPYEATLKAWLAAGIIPVFSAGNTGMGGCSTVSGPGDSPNVIGVGATTITDGLGALSSKGPTKDKRIKPDLTAPGINIRSANYPSDNAYKAIQGTSHAAPHVAGVIALMLSANKNLSFNQVRSILGETADRTPKLLASGYTCGGTADATYPNNQYGYGRVNALEAVRKAAAMVATQ